MLKGIYHCDSIFLAHFKHLVMRCLFKLGFLNSFLRVILDSIFFELYFSVLSIWKQFCTMKYLFLVQCLECFCHCAWMVQAIVYQTTWSYHAKFCKHILKITLKSLLSLSDINHYISKTLVIFSWNLFPSWYFVELVKISICQTKIKLKNNSNQ